MRSRTWDEEAPSTTTTGPPKDFGCLVSFSFSNWKGIDIQTGSLNESGPWETLIDDELDNTAGNKAASLLNFTFDKPVEVQFLKFDLLSYWSGTAGGGLQYFAAIPAGKY